MRKTKKQTDKRKRLAQAVAVSGDELRAFADGVERSVDGWRCVDVDAFRREVERRGADDPLVLVYVDRLRREVGWYAAGWHYGARRVSEILQSWKVQGKVAPAKKDEAGVVINLIDRLPKFYAGGADYCEWVEKRSSTLSSAISLKLGAGLDFLLCAPMMIRKGEVGILNLDSIMPGASKVQEEEVYTVFGLSGEIKAVRLVGLISRWFSVVVDALREIGQVLGISAAIEDLCMAFDGFPDVLICGRVEPRGDLELRIDEAMKRLEVVRREIAAADVARGAKGGAGKNSIKKPKSKYTDEVVMGGGMYNGCKIKVTLGGALLIKGIAHKFPPSCVALIDALIDAFKSGRNAGWVDANKVCDGWATKMPVSNKCYSWRSDVFEERPKPFGDYSGVYRFNKAFL